MRSLGLLRVVIVLAALGASSCGLTEIPAIDRDLPASYVRTHLDSGEDAIQEPFVWIPFLYHLQKVVIRTSDGFAASLEEDIGPLGVIVAEERTSQFDAAGRLDHHGIAGGVLWGLLFDYEAGWARTTRGWRDRDGFKFLGGLLGYTNHFDGSSTFYLFYAPLPLRYGDRDVQVLPERAPLPASAAYDPADAASEPARPPERTVPPPNGA